MLSAVALGLSLVFAPPVEDSTTAPAMEGAAPATQPAPTAQPAPATQPAPQPIDEPAPGAPPTDQAVPGAPPTNQPPPGAPPTNQPPPGAAPVYQPAPGTQVAPAQPIPAAPVDTPEIQRNQAIGTGLIVPGAILTITGIAGTVVGIHGYVRSRRSQCNDSEVFAKILTFGLASDCIIATDAEYAEIIARARSRQKIGLGFGIPALAVGTTLTIAGAVFLSRASNARKQQLQQQQLSLQPQWLPGGGGLVLRGAF